MILNAYSALKYWNLQFFWSCKLLVFCTSGNVHFPLDLHLQELCKKASPADSGRSGDHRVHCHTPHCRGRENPTGSLFDPKNAPERNQHCGYKRQKHTLVFHVLQSVSKGCGQHCLFYPGFGLYWLQTEPNCAHTARLWRSWKGNLGITSLPQQENRVCERWDSWG